MNKLMGRPKRGELGAAQCFGAAKGGVKELPITEIDRKQPRREVLFGTFSIGYKPTLEAFPGGPA
jgi:hypothetical protein